MRLVGAVLAGGQSRRFGSDKALAMVAGRPLIAHALDALRVQTDDVVVCGRNWPGVRSLDDRPGPGLGPLGGLYAALLHADHSGADAVLCTAVDIYPLPRGLRTMLGTGPSVLASQWSVGHWPVITATALGRHLAAGHRSLRSWIAASGARRVADAHLDLVNANRPEALLAQA